MKKEEGGLPVSLHWFELVMDLYVMDLYEGYPGENGKNGKTALT